MKKAYTKPEILFDSFELSQSIAAGCIGISNQAKQVCPVDFGGPFTLFATQCDMTPAPGNNNLVCYDVPSAALKVFSS